MLNINISLNENNQQSKTKELDQGAAGCVGMCSARAGLPECVC